MKKPNFVILMADDMGFSDVGCYGGEISTPNLDALAAKGLRFTQHYSTARCWPSRACILTGYYYQQVPAKPDGGPLPNWGRPLPHYLKPAGYRTYHSGKWHVNQFPWPVADGGFDRSYYIRDYNRNFATNEHSLDDQALPPAEPDSGYYSSTAIVDYAINFLDEHEERHASVPFFLYLAFVVPHFPLHAPQADIDPYRGTYDRGWDRLREERMERLRNEGIVDCTLSPRQPRTRAWWSLSEEDLQREIGPGESAKAVRWDRLTAEQKSFQAKKMEVHAAMVHRMDREIGRMIDRIKAAGEWENTVTIFVSDNGASAEMMIRGDGHEKGSVPGTGESYLCLGPGWSTAANTPFRYHKSWVHEGGIASPLIVHWPAGIASQGELRRMPSHFIDVVPTFLDLAGAATAPSWRSDNSPSLPGKSLALALANDVDVPRDPIFFRHDGHRALRDGKWKIVSLRNGPWELYDMEKDRSELHNLARNAPDRVRKLAAEWRSMHRRYVKQAGEARD
jgi:arylsulfatase A-like enzyme